MASGKIDPRLYAPFVEGYEYEDTSAEFVEEATPPNETLVPPMTGGGLQPPDSVQIVEQIFRKGADGKVLVDLVIEVEDVAGAENYEVRTAVN